MSGCKGTPGRGKRRTRVTIEGFDERRGTGQNLGALVSVEGREYRWSATKRPKWVERQENRQRNKRARQARRANRRR